MATRAGVRPEGRRELICLSHACVAYAEGADFRLALDDVSLTVEAGTFTAVVGRNASGKSTLAGVIADRIPVSRGAVRRTGGLRTAIVAQQAGGVPLADSVWDDVCVALEPLCLPRAELEERADHALHMVGLADFRMRDPLTLSGGERRVLALAASLAGEPDLLVFDEVTAMQDGREQERVLEVVRQICRQGPAIVWVTQRLEELAHADRVLALERGQTVFAGGPRDFFYGDAGPFGRGGDGVPRDGGAYVCSDGASIDGAFSSGDARPADGASVCDRLGLPAPCAVQAARRILAAGVRMPILPLTVEELAHACAGIV